MIARPSISWTATRNCSGVMLSSMITSTPAAKASRSCTRSSTSTSILTMWPTERLTRAIASPTPPATAMWLSLISTRVVEAEAVVDAAAGAHRLLLQRAQIGRRLARAGDPGPVGPGRLHQLGGGRGDAREMAQQVQRHALGAEHGAGRPVDPHHHVAGLDRPAVGPMDLHADHGVEQPEGQRRGVGAGDDAGLAGDDGAGAARVGREDRPARDVAGAADVLGQGGADQRLDEQRGQGFDHGGHAAVAVGWMGWIEAATASTSASVIREDACNAGTASGWSRRQ